MLSDKQLSELREGPLFEAAAPVLRLVSMAMAGHRTLFTVSDAEGLILDRAGDARALRPADTINALPGSRWTEEEMGTDAHPCSLRLELPVQISRFENYLEVNHDWVGSAAPIHDPPTKRQIGTLSLYGFRQIPHTRALDFVVEAATLIERNLHVIHQASRAALFEQYDRQRNRFPQDELVALDTEGVVLFASPGALRRFGTPVGGSSAIKLSLPNFPPRMKTDEVLLGSKSGASFKTTLVPVNGKHGLVGFLGILASKSTAARSHTPPLLWRASYEFSDIVGRSETLLKSIAQARRFAETDLPILISGESGTGKEIFAHAIHNASARQRGPFVPLNCGGLSEDLLAAELFGYTEGAFTGAVRGGRAGKLELADGGTIFLDEVDAMSNKMQVSLLRALEDGQVIPIGAESPLRVKIRLVCATNVDLTAKVREGAFRQDLYYRISGLSLNLPALRERESDVSLLTSYFSSFFPRPLALSPGAMERLEAYCWPGNIRQLKSVLQRASVDISGGLITEADLPPVVCFTGCRSSNCPLSEVMQVRASEKQTRPLKDIEREALVQALSECGGNVSRAAARLGLHRVTLYKKIKRHKIRHRTFP